MNKAPLLNLVNSCVLPLLVAGAVAAAGAVVAGEGAGRSSDRAAKVVSTQQGVAVDELSRLLKKLQTLQADFQQTTESQGGRRLQQSRGKVVVKHPNLFRWTVVKPFPQEVVSNGRHVSYFDQELEQLTLQDLDLNTQATPALLLSGDTSAILQRYRVSSAKTGNRQLFTLIPLKGEGAFQELKLGFEQGKLHDMQLLDALGSRTNILFSKVKVNGSVKDRVFELTVPGGIDVVDQRAKGTGGGKKS